MTATHPLLLLLATLVVTISGKVIVNSNSGSIKVKVAEVPPKKKPAQCSATQMLDGTCSPDATDGCADQHADCPVRASKGECEMNESFMLKQCKDSCFVCGTHGDIDIGIKQTISKDYADEIEARLLESRKYLKNVVDKDAKLRSLLLDACKLKHELCAFWAVIGECESNPTYMNMNCGPACQSCEQLTYENRCPINLKTMPNAWNPGDLNEFFINLTMGAEYKQYEPKVLSQEPWVVVLENFVSEQEAKRLIELGYQKGWKQSYDVGKVNPADGSYESRIHQGRTSTTAWCTGTCQDDAVTQTVVQRISNLTNIPETNSEYLQLLKYEKGQAYTVHHDYIAEHKDRQSGVRVMTVYLYLNDDVEEGGGTNFPELNVTVTPKRGRVVLWPSVLDEDPSVRDNRTLHQALPVVRGVKYGANAWIHLRDYQTPHQNGCGAVVRHAKK